MSSKASIAGEHAPGINCLLSLLQIENTKQARLPAGNTSLPMMAKALFSAILRRVCLNNVHDRLQVTNHVKLKKA